MQIFFGVVLLIVLGAQIFTAYVMLVEQLRLEKLIKKIEQRKEERFGKETDKLKR